MKLGGNKYVGYLIAKALVYLDSAVPSVHTLKITATGVQTGLTPHR